MAAAKILLIEDNKAISDYNREYLEQKGYDVSSAATLKEARRKLEFFPPDMLVLDIMMPDGCGIDFCRAIRADWRECLNSRDLMLNRKNIRFSLI